LRKWRTKTARCSMIMPRKQLGNCSSGVTNKRLTPDSNPGLDLGIDSLEWLNLTFEIRENAGVELTEAAIALIDAIRDLLREVSEASEAESESRPLDRPEEILTDKQKRWLEPP